MSTEKHSAGYPSILITKSDFPLGKVVMTPGARDALKAFEVVQFLQRHAMSDWGDCCEYDWKANDESREEGGRLLSVYYTVSDEKIWLITEADRSVTTFLLPSEY